MRAASEARRTSWLAPPRAPEDVRLNSSKTPSEDTRQPMKPKPTDDKSTKAALAISQAAQDEPLSPRRLACAADVARARPYAGGVRTTVRDAPIHARDS